MQTKIERPWGSFECILPSLQNYQVKRLTINPGHCTSLQKHEFRMENWCVVEGNGEAIIGDKRMAIKTGSLISVPRGVLHRLSNPVSTSSLPEKANDGDLTIIEIQIGSYLGEDDIERVEDVYGRI